MDAITHKALFSASLLFCVGPIMHFGGNSLSKQLSAQLPLLHRMAKGSCAGRVCSAAQLADTHTRKPGLWCTYHAGVFCYLLGCCWQRGSTTSRRRLVLQTPHPVPQSVTGVHGGLQAFPQAPVFRSEVRKLFPLFVGQGSDRCSGDRGCAGGL